MSQQILLPFANYLHDHTFKLSTLRLYIQSFSPTPPLTAPFHILYYILYRYFYTYHTILNVVIPLSLLYPFKTCGLGLCDLIE